MKLPPTDPGDVNDESGLLTYYTADQLRAYGLACAEAMREECARVIAAMPAQTWHDGSDQFGNPTMWKKTTSPVNCAAAIRSIEVER